MNNNRENESYIKLFKISEYLDFYRIKLSPNDNKNNQLNSENNNTIKKELLQLTKCRIIINFIK